VYNNSYNFFEREPEPEEIERLNEIRDLTDNEKIIERFERGYK